MFSHRAECSRTRGRVRCTEEERLTINDQPNPAHCPDGFRFCWRLRTASYVHLADLSHSRPVRMGTASGHEKPASLDTHRIAFVEPERSYAVVFPARRSDWRIWSASICEVICRHIRSYLFRHLGEHVTASRRIDTNWTSHPLHVFRYMTSPPLLESFAAVAARTSSRYPASTVSHLRGSNSSVTFRSTCSRAGPRPG